MTPALLISDVNIIKQILVDDKHKFTDLNNCANLIAAKKNFLLTDVRRTQPLIEDAIGATVQLIAHKINNNCGEVDLIGVLAESNQLVAQSALVLDQLTIATLANCLYFLAHHQDVQEKLINELLEHNQEFSYNQINKLHYLDCVINETLRLCPSLSRLQFVANSDVNCGDLLIEKATMVTISLYCVLNCEQNFELSSKFIPERFGSRAGHFVSAFSVQKVLMCPLSHNPKAFVLNYYPLINKLETKLTLIRLLNAFKFKKVSRVNESFEENYCTLNFLPGNVMQSNNCCVIIEPRA